MRVEGRRVDDYKDLERPGDFFITEANPFDKDCRSLTALCPCGCGAVIGARIKDGETAATDIWWGWDGSWDKPTITPSIKVMDGCKWHGHLQAGVWTGENET